MGKIVFLGIDQGPSNTIAYLVLGGNVKRDSILEVSYANTGAGLRRGSIGKGGIWNSPRCGQSDTESYTNIKSYPNV